MSPWTGAAGNRQRETSSRAASQRLHRAEGEVAVAAFDGRVGGQSDRGKHGLGEVVEGSEGASERGGQQRVGVEVLVRGGGAARIAVDVDASAMCKLGLPGQSGHVEGDVVVVVCLPEAVEDSGGRFEGGA